MDKYEIVFDHTSDQQPTVLRSFPNMKEAKEYLKSFAEITVNEIIWTTGRRGFIALIGGRIVYHIRIEVFGVIK